MCTSHANNEGRRSVQGHQWRRADPCGAPAVSVSINSVSTCLLSLQAIPAVRYGTVRYGTVLGNSAQIRTHLRGLPGVASRLLSEGNTTAVHSPYNVSLAKP